MLKKLIRKELIAPKVSASNWCEALKCGTDLLLTHGCIKARYYEKIVENFNELGPYMLIAPGLVLAHARPEDGVIKTAISIVNLKEPVSFFHETNDPARLIVTLAPIDNSTHLEALAQLVELFNNSEDLHTLMNSSSREEIYATINKYAQNTKETK